MAEHVFETPDPVTLSVSLGRGRVAVDADELTRTVVSVSGEDADQVQVERHGSQVQVVGPRNRVGFLGREPEYDVSVTLPSGSDLSIRTGSADVAVQGPVLAVQVRTGSGDVRVEQVGGPTAIETGSGEIEVGDVRGDFRARSGSGDVAVRRAARSLTISTGSGDVHLGASAAPASLKTGSGDLRVGEADADLSMSTGSGDLVVDRFQRGRFTARGASGDVHVGVPPGIPVWTDLLSMTGEIRSDLAGSGRPEADADHIELRAKTVSGDITLHQL